MFLLMWSCLWLSGWAQAPDPRWQPVREGEGWRFTDPVYGYSLCFADNFVLEANPEAMRSMAEYSKEVLGPDSCQPLGPRFTLTDSTRFRPDFVPSLNAVVQSFAGGAAISREQFFGKAKEQVEAGLKGARVTGQQWVVLNGLEFYRLDYEFPFPPTGTLIYARCYAYYDVKARVGYAFTVGASGPSAPEDMEALEVPLRTIHIAPLPAPAGQEGPSG